MGTQRRQAFSAIREVVAKAGVGQLRRYRWAKLNEMNWEAWRLYEGGNTGPIQAEADGDRCGRCWCEVCA